MISLFHSLQRGERLYAEKFAASKSFWEAFFRGKEDWNAGDFSEELSTTQRYYEMEVWEGNRTRAKEVMALTALTYLYSEVEGFGDNLSLALNVAKGFLGSMCSVEVKSYAEDAIRAYSLDADDRELAAKIQR